MSNFKGDFIELGYMGETTCFLLASYLYKGEKFWMLRSCKEEFGYQAKRYKNTQFLFFGKSGLDKVSAKFNQYAEQIGLVARAEMSILENLRNKTYPVVVVNNVENILEREAAAMLIKTLYYYKNNLILSSANINNLFQCTPYFFLRDNLCNVFLNWKEFISGVTEEQLNECYYEFHSDRDRGNGGLIDWLEHIFKK